MDQGDDDGFGGLPLHAEVGIGAADVPRHGLAGLDMNNIAGLHRSVRRNQGRVGQGNVPRRGGGFA